MNKQAAKTRAITIDLGRKLKRPDDAGGGAIWDLVRHADLYTLFDGIAQRPCDQRWAQWVHARARLGLSQEALAHALGYTLATVNRKERGKVPVTGTDLLALEALERRAADDEKKT